MNISDFLKRAAFFIDSYFNRCISFRITDIAALSAASVTGAILIMCEITSQMNDTL